MVSGVTPPASKEIAEVSHSIFDVLSWMNKESDNHSAITVFKVVGAVYDSPPGLYKKVKVQRLIFLLNSEMTEAVLKYLKVRSHEK